MNPALSTSALGVLLATSLWFTADQQGWRAFRDGDFKAAAQHFEDPMWKGAALYRDGDFKQAQLIFSRLDSAEAHYNRGNCLVLLGRYQDAVPCYERALAQRPDWTEAQQNREIAISRAAHMQREGSDMGEQMVGADEFIFDNNKKGGQDTEVGDQQPANAAAVQALWLRRVNTRPSEFLKAKFAYQQRLAKEGEP